jgi:hypothetical protein
VKISWTRIVGIVLIHFDLFENHAAFLRDIVGTEGRVQNEVRENVHGEGKMLVEHLDVETDTLLRGEGIHVAANRIHLAGDRLGGTRFRSLEHHVLDKVRDAVKFRLLIARARLQPDTDRNGTNVRHLFGDNGQAVGEDLSTNAAGFFYH